jgi:hypothetical protein
LAKHKGRSIAIVLATVGVKQRRVSGERQMLVYAGESLQRHAAKEYGEVRSVVALKSGVGDHTPERFADHELGSRYRGLDLPRISPDLWWC